MILTDPILLAPFWDVLETQTVAGVGTIEICKADPTRVFLAVAVVAVAGTKFLTQNPNLGATPGIPLVANDLLEFPYSRWGALVQSAWWVRGAGASATLSVFESFWRPHRSE